MGVYLEHNTEVDVINFMSPRHYTPPPGHSSLNISHPRQFSPPPPPPRHFPSRYLVRYDIYYIPYFYVINVYYIITYINSCYHMGTISEMGGGVMSGGGGLSGGNCPRGGGVSGYPILLIDHTESIFYTCDGCARDPNFCVSSET